MQQAVACFDGGLLHVEVLRFASMRTSLHARGRVHVCIDRKLLLPWQPRASLAWNGCMPCAPLDIRGRHVADARRV